jgi:hypothetical protein
MSMGNGAIMELILIGVVILLFVYYYRQPRKSSSVPIPAATPEQVAKIEAWIRNRTDNMQQVEMICGDPPIGFDYDEQVVFCLPGIDLMESRAVRYSRGTYGGPSVRVMKGLSFRFGTSASRSQSVDELTVIDHGTLVLTTKRLAFLGAGRANNVMLQDVIGTVAYTDGIQLHREHKQKAETYLFSHPLTILEGSGAGLPVNGAMVVTSIKIAKLLKEAGPSNVAALRRKEFKVVPIK